MNDIQSQRFPQLTPELISPVHQGDIVSTFGVCMPEYAGMPAMRAHRVHVRKLLEHQSADAALGQGPSCGSSHCAASEHNDVEMIIGHLATLFVELGFV